ncbi:MAG: glycosyl transferase, partial [Alistipes sp.]|nr:glycosyl transferase [Alistipes sp.]
MKNPRAFLRSALYHGGGKFLPDAIYLKLKYRLHLGRKLHLDNPQTFNEKIQWLKLHNRKADYTMMVDKIEVKN